MCNPREYGTMLVMGCICRNIPAVLAFLVFLLAYTPCVATLAAQRQEVGLRWTLVGIGMQLGVAWLLAVAVFQLGRAIT